MGDEQTEARRRAYAERMRQGNKRRGKGHPGRIIGTLIAVLALLSISIAVLSTHHSSTTAGSASTTAGATTTTESPPSPGGASDSATPNVLPLSQEGEAVAPGDQVSSCARCSGGKAADDSYELDFHFDIEVPGAYNLAIYFVCGGGPRNSHILANGAEVTVATFPVTDPDTPQVFNVRELIKLHRGSNEISMFNATGSPPETDRLVLTLASP